MIPGLDPVRASLIVLSVVKAQNPETSDLMDALIKALPPIAPTEQSFTPTELGEMLEPKVSAIAANKKLEAAGLQERYQTASGKNCWRATEKGEEHAVITIEAKANGAPVECIRWKRSALTEISVRLLATR
jgi:hypothetical protein